jgi:phosphoribosylamine--glycine ligase
MKVLVVGGGGREHALTWRLAADPDVSSLHAAPGNAGIAAVARCHAVPADDIDGLVELAEELDADLTVIGPEAPLVGGLSDALAARRRLAFGPFASAARLEGSKSFAKDLLDRHRIPTAHAGIFDDPRKALAFVDELGGRAVVKADGLAGGKGVVVALDRDRAATAIHTCLVAGAFGDAGRTVVVEEVLEGHEISAFALVDGDVVVPLGFSQDFKRVADGDEGPNTGGMGAYAPVPLVDASTERAVWDGIVQTTADALASDGISFRGALFAGLMLTDGGPKVLEFNCRFGDPETEALMPRLATPLARLLLDGARGSLAGADVAWRDEAAVTVVCASHGYPAASPSGVPIDGLDAASGIEGAMVFHSGTAHRDGRVVTAGGRVLAVTGVGASLAEARDHAYEACGTISFEGMHYRRDIAARAAEEANR